MPPCYVNHFISKHIFNEIARTQAKSALRHCTGDKTHRLRVICCKTMKLVRCQTAAKNSKIEISDYLISCSERKRPREAEIWGATAAIRTNIILRAWQAFAQAQDEGRWSQAAETVGITTAWRHGWNMAAFKCKLFLCGEFPKWTRRLLGNFTDNQYLRSLISCFRSCGYPAKYSAAK